MRRFFTIFVSAVLISAIAATSLFAQDIPPDIALNLEKPQQRIFFEAAKGTNNITLNGLTIGKTYMLIATAPDLQQRPVLRLINEAAEAASVAISNPDRPNLRVYVATAEQVQLQVENPGFGPLSFFLSVNCKDCEKESSFLENFINDIPDAVLSSTPGASANSLVTNTLIGGNCFDVTNITSSGTANSRGTFNNGATNIGINNGVVLCSGNVNICPGPNTATNTSGNTAGFNTNSPNDPDLATLTAGDQFDVTKIEFDFKPTAANIQFDFVFASEEYCEWVGSSFNDVFGFFISGPGISGTQDIALIPSTATPVAINSVNHNTNTAFYVNNNTFNACGGLPAISPAEVSFDGFTTVLTAMATVQPCSTYHIKLALADVGDAALASAVFLKANSFEAGGQIKAEPVYPGGGSFVYEGGCGGVGYIKFIRGSGDINVDAVVNYTIAGTSTATEGVDYATLPNPVIIPAGQSFILIPITVFPDLIIEGNETITLLLDNPCSCTQQPVTFTIVDVPPLEAEMDDQVLCGGAGANLAPTITSGVAPYTYLWSTNATTSGINVTTPGSHTYTVTVTDACMNTTVVSATVDLTPAPTAVLSGSGFLCAGVPSSFNLIVTLTGLGPWEVEWSGGTQTFTSSPGILTVTDPGTYTLTSVEAGVCPGTVSGSVTVTEIDVNINLNGNNPGCFGANTGSITSTTTGGTAPYTYVWSPVASGANPTGLGAGTYAVTVTSSQGCTETADVTLDQPDLLTATLTAPGIDCNNPTSQADLDVNGGTPNYSYIWSNGAPGSSPTFNMGGNYTVTVTDSHSCTTSTTVSIPQNTTLPTAIATVTGQITCINTEITINGNGSSTGSQFEYEWSGPNLVSGETTLNPIVDGGGTYVLTVTNTDNGCTKTVAVSVVQNITPPIAVIANPPNIGCNMPTISLNGTGSSTGANFTFVWSTVDGNFIGGTNTLTPTANLAGTYNLVVTNTQNGCTDDAIVTINGNIDPPVATIEPPITVTCNDPTINLDGSNSSSGPGIIYQWSGPPGGINSGGNTTNPVVDLGGTYTITVTNTLNNCTTTASVVVAQNTTPPIAVGNVSGIISCQTPTLIINGNGSSIGANFTYEWTTTNGNIVQGETTLNPEVNQGGTYTLVVTNETSGCTKSVTVNVPSNNSIPLVNAGPPLTLNCIHPTWQISGSGSSGPNFTYQWTATSGNIVSGATTLSPTINMPGCYTLVVTNITNQCTAEDVVCIDSNFDTPDAIIAPPIQIDCNNPTIDLDATASTQPPGITYTWTGPPGGINSGANSDSPVVDQPGLYSLTITNTESGCTDMAQVTVVRNITPPVAEAGPGFELDCLHPTYTLNGNGSSMGSQFEFEWGTTNGNIVSGETTLSPVVDEAGLYRITVTNTSNGCTSTDVVSITVDQNSPNANAGPDKQLNCNNFSVSLSGSATPSGLTYQWTTLDGNITSGQNSLSPVVNQEGTYTLVITNPNNGCTDESEVFITNNISYPMAVVVPPLQLDCNNPTVELDATGSDPGPNGANLIFQWTGNPPSGIQNGGNSATPTIIAPGTYSLIVRNNTSFCTATAAVVVIRDIVPPVAVATSPPPITCQFPQVTLSGAGSSLSYPFFYEWTTTNGNIVSGEYTLFPVVNQIGTYTLIVLNQDNGCTTTATSTVITNQTFPTAVAGPQQTITCANDTLVLNGVGSSAGNQFAYIWNTQNGHIISGNTTLSPLVDQPGTYELSVVNTQTGCTSLASVQVGLNISPPLAVAAPGGILSCTVPLLSLNGVGSSTGANFLYNWTTTTGNILSGVNTLSPLVNAVGQYILAVTNQTNGCTATIATSVQADASLPIAAAGNPDTITCFVSQVTLNAMGSTQGAGINYQWSGTGLVTGINTLAPTVNAAGAYSLQVTNTNNGCTAVSTVLVADDTVLPITEAGAPATINCTFPTQTLNGSASSLGIQYSYLWTTSNGNIISGNNTLNPVVDTPGDYNLFIINNLNGCTGNDLVSINQNTILPIAEAGANGYIDCTHPVINLTGSSGNAPQLVFQWTTPNGNIAAGANTLTPSIDVPGQYVLVVTDTINGCTATDMALVTKDANVPVAAVAFPGPINCYNSTVQLNGTNSTAGLQYAWTTSNGNFVSGQNSLQPVVNLPGQYTLSVLNVANNCLAQFTQTVVIDTIAPAADAGNPAIISCLDPLLSLNGTQSSAGANYIYMWNTIDGNILSGMTTPTPSVDQSGYYTIVVTDQSNGCTAESTVQILLDQNTPEADAGADQLLTCAVNILQLNGTASSQGSIFSYLWTGPGLVFGQNTLTPAIDAPGTYELLISNAANGCTSTAQVTVDQDIAPPSVALAIPQVLNCSLTATSLQATNSSQLPNFSYVWTATSGGSIVSGATTTAPVIDAPGLYNLLITNTLTGCVSTEQTQVTEDIATPAAIAGPSSQLNCTIPTYQLSGSATNTGPNFQIQWTTSGTGNILSGANTYSPIVNAPGTYTLLLTNTDNFCTSTDQVLITQNVNAPTAVAAPPQTLTCAIPAVNLNGQGSSAGSTFSYLWTTQNGQIASGETTLMPAVTAPGLYVLQVTNTQNNCVSQVSVTVPQNIQAPVAMGGSPVLLTCSATTIGLNGQGSSNGPLYNYLWTVPAGSNGNLLSGITTLTPVVNAPGAYRLLVTNVQNGCTTTTTAQVIQDINAPNAAAATPGELTCNITSLALNGAGSSNGSIFTYLWSTANGNIISGNTTLVPVVDDPGNYTLQVTNTNNGCKTLANINVSENVQPPVVNAGVDDRLTCTILALNLSGTASGGVNGIAQQWSGPGIVAGGTTFSPVINLAGTYTLTVTDLYNGCKNENTVDIIADTQAPDAVIALPNLLTCVVKEISLVGNASSQGPQYVYQWSGSGITGSPTSLTTQVNQPGNYSLLVTNQSNGCINTTTAIVPQDIQLPTAEAGTGFELTCSVQEDQLSAKGSSSGNNFAYLWTTTDGVILQGASSAAPLVNQIGTYHLLVTNVQTGCSSTDLTVVTRNTNYPSALELATVKPACGDQRGAITFAEITGGVGPYLYSVDGGENFFAADEFIGLTPGIYPLVVQDANGCEYDEQLVFPVPVEPEVTAIPEITLDFGDSQTITANLNIPIYEVDSVIWSPLTGLTFTNKPDQVIAQPFQTTQYEVRIINKDGCEDRAVILVKVGEPAIYAPNVITPDAQNGSNDIFLIFAKEGHVKKIRTLQIYDRWGNKVFLTTDVQPNDRTKGWDGRFNGEPMNPAVFVWWAEVELASGDVILLDGDVTIIR
jgi:gliding motility-associated-like protein